MRHYILILCLLCFALVLDKTVLAQPNAAMSPATITLSKYDVGSEPVTFMGFKVHNSGNQPLRFVTPGFLVSGPDADQFQAIALTVLDPVPAHSSRSGNRVYFYPTSRGTKNAVLNV